MRGYHVKITLQNKQHPPQSSKDGPFIPLDLFQNLPAHEIEYSKRRNTITAEHPDYRRGPIIIDWMDFDDSKKANQTASRKEKERGRGWNEFTIPAVHILSVNLGTLEAIFRPRPSSKTGSTNLPEGTVHVYRDSASKPSQDQLENAASIFSNIMETESDEIMLGVLAVPSWMTPSDFLKFVAPATDDIAHLRIIRSEF